MGILSLDYPGTRRRLVGITLLAWVGVLGFDLMLHGAILSPLYTEGGSFQLPPLEAFRRIPLGYASFLVSTAFLTWLSAKLGVGGWREGMMLGGVFGGVIWLSIALGMYSISTASPAMLVGWFIGQTLETAYAGGIIGQGLRVAQTRRLVIIVALITLGFIILTITLQSLGLASSTQISPP